MSNIYKPAKVSVLAAALLMILIAVVIVMIVVVLKTGNPGNSGNPETTPVVTTEEGKATTPAASDATSEVTTAETPTTAKVTTKSVTTRNPYVTVPVTKPAVIGTPEIRTVTVDNTSVNRGSLLMIDDKHQYKVEGTLPTRAELGKQTASAILKDYGLVSIFANKSSTYKIPSSAYFINADVMDSLNAMLDAFYVDTMHTDVQVRNGYYCDYSEKVPLANIHATGYAICLNVINETGTYPLNMENLKLEYYEWFIANCWKFGFIHVKDYSGYSQFRWVGMPHAAYIHSNNITFDAYIELVRKYNADNPLKIEDAIGREWWVYYASAGEGEQTELSLWDGLDACTVSGDNAGGFVISADSWKF